MVHTHRRRLSGSAVPTTVASDSSIYEREDERTPLLDQNGKSTRQRISSWRNESWKLWKLALPMWLTHLLEWSIGGVTIVALGRLGIAELNAASIAQLLITTTTISPILYGLTSALDTLATQAWTSENPKNTSLYAQRTGLLMCICMVPAGFVLFFSEHIFLLIKQDPETARLAGLYTRIYMLGLPFLGGFELLRRWLLAQGLVNVPTYALVVASPSCLLLNYLLVLGPPPFRLGFIGAPIATVITEVLMLAVMLVYVLLFAPRTAWGGWTTAMFYDLGPNIKLGIAGIILTASDWLVWDAVSLTSSYLGARAFAANQCAVLISVTIFQLPYAITVSAGIRIGNLLGAQLPRSARVAAKTIWLSGLFVGCFNSVLLLIFRKRLGKLVTDDEEVVALVADLVPLIAIFQIADSVTGATQGVLRGSGLSPLAARCNIAAYYLAGIPAGLLLTFRFHMGLKGLWLGLVIALAFNAAINTFFTSRIDWEKRAGKAREQSQATEAYLQSRRNSNDD